MVYLTHLLFLLLLFSSCSSLEQILDSKMTIQWSVSGDSIDITFICKISTGYCSIGFAESMTNCDMIAALSDGTTVTLQDYYSYNHDTPATDQALGGTVDIVYVTGGLDTNGDINVTFKRKLTTGDAYDQDIVPDIKSHICWAYRDHGRAGDQWQEHSGYSNF